MRRRLLHLLLPMLIRLLLLLLAQWQWWLLGVLVVRRRQVLRLFEVLRRALRRSPLMWSVHVLLVMTLWWLVLQHVLGVVLVRLRRTTKKWAPRFGVSVQVVLLVLCVRRSTEAGQRKEATRAD